MFTSSSAYSSYQSLPPVHGDANCFHYDLASFLGHRTAFNKRLDKELAKRSGTGFDLLCTTWRALHDAPQRNFLAIPIRKRDCPELNREQGVALVARLTDGPDGTLIWGNGGSGHAHQLFGLILLPVDDEYRAVLCREGRERDVHKLFVSLLNVLSVAPSERIHASGAIAVPNPCSPRPRFYVELGGANG